MRDFINIVEAVSPNVPPNLSKYNGFWVHAGNVKHNAAGAFLRPYTMEGLRQACKEVPKHDMLSICRVPDEKIFDFTDENKLSVVMSRYPALVEKMKTHLIAGHLPWPENNNYRELMRKFMMKLGFKGMIVMDHESNMLLYMFDTKDIRVMTQEPPSKIRVMVGAQGGYGMPKDHKRATFDEPTAATFRTRKY